jgi:hypothetical protein
MWQDVLVTLVAAGAVAVLGRRWLRARSAQAGSCPSCASGANCGASTPMPQEAEQGAQAAAKPLILIRK